MAKMNYAEVFPEVCKHGRLQLCRHCHLFITAPNKHEDRISCRISNKNSYAEFRKDPDESSLFYQKAKHVPDKTGHGSTCYKGKGSYQLQRYLKEPAGCGATLFIEAAPAPHCTDLLNSSNRNGKRKRKRRTETMGRKIKALEKKLTGF